MIIFLADLQNSYYRYIRNSVPIGMGYVAAYLRKVFGKAVEVHQFRRFEELHEALRHKTPQVVAFGSYTWNTRLTLKACSYLRVRLSDVVIAVGGPDVSEVLPVTAKELEVHPEVDFYMPNEGEGPLRNLVEAVLGENSEKVRRKAIHGCLSRDRETGEILGDVIGRLEEDINEIPSPYFDGLMDRFLQDSDYLPIIQTARGCPYQCTFCVSGRDSWNKVKAFSVDRVKEEIDYIERRAVNRYLRLADENFGILHRDIEIAEYVARKRRETGFPTALSVYTDKHPTERVRNINLLLRELMPFNISYQTMTESVLTNIKRVNLRDCRIMDTIEFARASDLMLVSELIFALPGETLQSFLDSIDRLVHLRFESVAINQLHILKGAEMDLPEDRRQYRVRTMFSMSENGYTIHPDLENIEIDEWVVENSTLSREEYFQATGFTWLFEFGHYRGFLREILFFFETLGVRTTELLWRAQEDPSRCPIASGYAAKFVSRMQQFLFGSREEVEAFVREKMATNPREIEDPYRLKDRLMIDLLMGGHLPRLVEELASVGREIYRERAGIFDAELQGQLDLIKQVTALCHIPLDRSSDVELTVAGPYDVAAWVRDRYLRPLGHYRLPSEKQIGLRIRNVQNYQNLWGNSDTLLERYLRHFQTINSSNRRRIVVEVSDQFAILKAGRAVHA